MSSKWQKTPEQLALFAVPTSEAREPAKGTELPMAERDAESPAGKPQLMEAICGTHVPCERENLREALKRVKANQGSPGIDGMTVVQLPEYLQQHWPVIREQLLSGTYKPQAVQRVEIEKQDGSGMRKLGIPTVLDRFIQQAVMQVLQRQWDPTFSDSSYGFRPGRSAQQAVAQAQQYIAEGRQYAVRTFRVVDLDLEKFFDRVNHDKLMRYARSVGQIAKRVEDKRLLKLIRAFLTAGVMRNARKRGGCGTHVPWAGESERGRDAARRPTFALAVQPGAGRTRPGVDATRPPFRALCGRLQYLRSQRAGGAARDGKREALPHDQAKAQGKRVEKRRGATAGAQVRNGCVNRISGF